jgi:hypothetical protein
VPRARDRDHGRSAERSSAALHACEGLDTPDLAGNKAGWLAEVVHAAAGVEAELAAVTADRDGLLVHQANLVGKLAGLRERIQSHEQPIDIEERIRWHKSEARRLTLESIRGGQPSDIGER